MKKTLFIAVPTMGHMSVGTALWFARTAQERAEETFISITNAVAPVSRARNSIIKAFLKSECKYLMMVDHDTLPPVDTVERLMAHLDNGASLATGITPIKRDEGRSFNVYREYPDVEKFQPFDTLPKEPFNVVGCGLSCAMVTREAVEKLVEPYCMTIEFENGAYCSEDLYFCEKIIKSGGTIIADPNIICGHVKEFIM